MSQKVIKRKNKTLTLKDKIAIINMLDNGETIAEVADHFGVSRFTIHDIKYQRSKILQNMAVLGDRKTIKVGRYPEMETELYHWFLEERNKCNFVTGEMLKERAKEIYFNLTQQEFKASNGWLDKFKQRHGIKFSNALNTFLSHDEILVQSFVKNFKEKVEQLRLSPDQLYCMDASNLMIRVIKKAVESNDDNIPSKKCNEKITFVPCSNATGTHKMDLLVIGKDEFNDASLPVCYKYQWNGWLTKELFTSWFHDEFVPNVRSFMNMNNFPGKALLILDGGPGYPEDFYLKSNDWMIQAMFLPTDFSHFIQPMDQSLMERLKKLYKKKLLRDIIAKGADMKQNLTNLNLNEVLYALCDSWNSLSGNVIRRSWKKLYPDIVVFAEDEVDDDISADWLLLAFRGSGINDKDISEWLAGNIDEIQDVPVNTDDTFVVNIKTENPLLSEKYYSDASNEITMTPTAAAIVKIELVE